MFGIFLIVVGIGAAIIGLILFIALCIGGSNEEKESDIEFEKIIDEGKKENEEEEILKELGIDEIPEDSCYSEDNFHIEESVNNDLKENVCENIDSREEVEKIERVENIESIENIKDVNENSDTEEKDRFDRDKKLDPEEEIEFKKILEEYGIEKK